MFIIYVLDEQGEMDPTFPPFVDGTMEGPDALMELLAMHLHRLGAPQATQGVFLGDGADWIWARIPWVVAKVGLAPSSWKSVVDLCHVMEHVSTGLGEVFGEDSPAKKIQLSRLKNQLKNGKLEECLEYLRSLSEKKEKVKDQIAYMERRRNLLDYSTLLENRLPIGSGAVESTIRRVINQRLKAPGTFWRKERVEPMLYMRAQALTGRWEEMMAQVHETARRDRRRNVQIEPATLCTDSLESLLIPFKSSDVGIAA